MERLTPRVVDETDFGFGWIGGEQPKLQLASHAIASDGRVWLVDPTDEPSLDERIHALGEPAGVIQLLDRHNRGAAEVAARFGIPHHRVPLEGVPASPFEPVPLVRRKRWRELALWWPERRALAGYEPEHVLVGHGEGVHEGAAAAVRDALAHSRRRALRLPLELPLMIRR